MNNSNNWNTYDLTGGIGNWVKCSSGYDYYLWCGDLGTTKYINNLNDVAMIKESFNLTKYYDIQLTFESYCEINESDFGYVEISDDGGRHWNDLYVFMMNHWKDIRDAKSEVKAHDFDLNGYAFMMWHPILTIAKYLEKFVGGKPLEEMIYLATEKTLDRKKELMDNYDRQLLKVIKEMIDARINLTGQKNQIFLLQCFSY